MRTTSRPRRADGLPLLRADMCRLPAIVIWLSTWSSCVGAGQPPPQTASSGGAPVVQAENESAKAIDPIQTSKRFVLEGMRHTRRQVRSGTCAIVFKSGTDYVTTSQLSESGESKILVTFNAEGDVRMECTYPRGLAERHHFVDPTDPGPEPASETRTGYFIHTKDRNIQWFQGRQNMAYVMPPESACPNWVPPFDWRAIGIYSWLEFKRGTAWDALCDAFAKQEASAVVESPANVYTITWPLGSPNSEWIVSVNGDKGFSAFHAMMRQRPSSNTPWRTVQDFKSDWEEKSSVWLPTHYEGSSTQQPNVVTSSLIMDLSWTAVNQPPDDRLFKLDSLLLPQTVHVVDSRLGTPVEIEHASFQPVIADGPANSSARRERLVFLFIGNVAVLVIIGAVWLVRRRSRTRHTP